MAIELVDPAMTNGANGNGISNGVHANGKRAAGNGDLNEKQPLHDDLNPLPLRATATATNTIVQPTPVKAGSKDVEAGKRSPSPPPKIEAGRHPDAVYAESLAPWRDSFRRWCVRRLGPESERIARWQAKVRTPARDTFFFYSAIFGSEWSCSAPLADRKHGVARRDQHGPETSWQVTR